MGCKVEIDREESRGIESAGKALSGERLDDGDDSHNVGVKVDEIVGGNPELLVRAAACDLDRVALRDDGIDFKLGYKPGVAGLGVGGVPVASDTPCIIKGKNGIEDRLIGKTRRERSESRLSDEPTERLRST